MLTTTQFNATPPTDPIFSKQRMRDTLTSGYFEMLGVLSRRKEGLECVTSRLEHPGIAGLPDHAGFLRSPSYSPLSTILASFVAGRI